MTTEAAANFYLAKHLLDLEGRRIAIFNPNKLPIEELPVIMAFSNSSSGGEGVAYAMAEDGTVLGSHYCSHEGYVSYDLGVLEGTREDRHEHYRLYYPNGYRMEFVSVAENLNHEKLKEAYRLNQLKGERGE